MRKIQPEVWLAIAFVFFLLSWLIDRLGGPVSIVVKSPIAFLASTRLLNTYPFTATAIIIRTLAIFISMMLIMSFIHGKYFTKAITLFFIGMLAEFYAIQQLATGSHLTSIQWTLSIAYGSVSLILGILFLVLKGIWATFNKEDKTVTKEEDKSVLEPPQENN
jgi:hypothetical protein